MGDLLPEGFEVPEDAPLPAGQLILDTLRVEDLPALMAIEERSFSAPWSEATYRHEVTANPMAFYYVIRPPRASTEAQREEIDSSDAPSDIPGAETRAAHTYTTDTLGTGSPNSDVLAYGGFWLAGDEAHIVTIASHPELRGHKLGETMLLFLLQQAQSLGATIATLEVRPSNAPALGLYRKWGFEEEGRRKGYYRDNHEDALIYTLRDLHHPMTFLPIVMALGINVTSPDLPIA